MGIFRSSITLGSAVTTTVWSSAAMKAPSPVMVRMAQVERILRDSLPGAAAMIKFPHQTRQWHPDFDRLAGAPLAGCEGRFFIFAVISGSFR